MKTEAEILTEFEKIQREMIILFFTYGKNVYRTKKFHQLQAKFQLMEWMLDETAMERAFRLFNEENPHLKPNSENEIPATTKI